MGSKGCLETSLLSVRSSQGLNAMWVQSTGANFNMRRLTLISYTVASAFGILSQSHSHWGSISHLHSPRFRRPFLVFVFGAYICATVSKSGRAWFLWSLGCFICS